MYSTQGGRERDMRYLSDDEKYVPFPLRYLPSSDPNMRSIYLSCPRVFVHDHHQLLLIRFSFRFFSYFLSHLSNNSDNKSRHNKQ